MSTPRLLLTITGCVLIVGSLCDVQAQDLRARITQDFVGWDSIEGHRTGSEGDNATADWLAAEIREVGLKPQIDRFEFRRRVPKDCSITFGETRIRGVPLFDGGRTGPEPIRAKLGRPGESGTIALTQFAPNPGDPKTLEMIATRTRTEHLAVIAVATENQLSPGISLLNAEAYNQPFGLPVLQVASEDGNLLKEALADARQVEFRAQVELEDSTASNVQVTISGKQPDLSPLVIMTPRSGWWTCTSERGGGISVWLECIRYFASHQPTRTVIFTANSGHELSHLGLEHYLRQNRALIKDAHVWIHLGANFAARNGDVFLQASSDELMNLLNSQLKAQCRIEFNTVPTKSRPFGEARNIYDGSGQYVSILGRNPLFHHPHDRWPHAVDLPKTEGLTRGLLQVAKRLAD